MFRDRTSLYYSYRQSYARHPVAFPYSSSAASATAVGGVAGTTSIYGSSLALAQNPMSSRTADEDRNPLLSDGGSAGGKQSGIIGSAHGDGAIELDVLPPSWTDVGDEVDEILAMVKTKSAQLEKLHQEHVLPGFDDRSEQEKIIENLTVDITQHFHVCQRLIGKLDLILEQSHPTSAQIQMSRNMKISLATKVQEASTAFRKKQSAYLKKLRGNKAASLPLLSSSSTTPAFLLDDEGTNDAANNQDDVSYSQSQLRQSAQLAQASTDHVIRQREAEITQIAQGILELSEIFKELQTMVIDQGTVLDRIDYNIETMKEHVKAADTELRQASHYQQRTQKCKIILFLCLIILLLFQRRSGVLRRSIQPYSDSIIGRAASIA
ncbi:t-SNARE [Limtongia smithiae]|uniref:t-SNARE n=1 Tax=Limtongia smithiae TaxID=1125753 RepID=UPI0034CE6D63